MLLNTPSIYRFLERIGRDDIVVLNKEFNLLMISAGVFALINIAFLISHFFIKGYITPIFKNKIYLYWIVVANLGLACVFLHCTFKPIYGT